MTPVGPPACSTAVGGLDCPEAPEIVDDGASPGSATSARSYCVETAPGEDCATWTDGEIVARMNEEPWSSDHRKQAVQVDDVGDVHPVPEWDGIAATITCGPVVDAEGRCCVTAEVEALPYTVDLGRPLRVDGRARVAAAPGGADPVAASNAAPTSSWRLRSATCGVTSRWSVRTPMSGSPSWKVTPSRMW